MSEKNPLLDFRKFLFLVWRYLKLPSPTPRQYYIAHYLQHGPRRKVIEAFRGVGKSWITAAYVLWRLYCNPNINILVVSASKARADSFTTFCLRLITEIPELTHLYPKEGQRCSKIMFDVGPAPASQTASVVSIGITGMMTGNRADLIVADDVEVPNNSATALMREKLAESIKEFDAILKPGGEVVFLGTPQTEESIYNKLAERGYEVRIWPVRYPNQKQIDAYGPRLAPDVIDELRKQASLLGKTTEPTRFSEMDLMEREASYGKAGFALQFMLDTNLSDVDRYPLKLSDLIVLDLDSEVGPNKTIWTSSPENVVQGVPNVGMGGDRYYSPARWEGAKFEKYTGIVLAIDPSGRGRDETAYAVVAALNGYLFLLDAGGYSEGYSLTTLQALADTAKKYKVNRVLVEANFGDGMYTQLLKPVLTKTHSCTIEEVKHSVQKEKRIVDTLEPVMSSHRLVIDKSLIKKDYDSTLFRPSDNRDQEVYRLFYQLTRITRERGALRNDDRLDALSMAVAYWTRLMSVDVDKEIEKRRQDDLDQELRRFVAHALGRKFSRQRVWARPVGR